MRDSSVGVCKEHLHIDRTMQRLELKVDDGFGKLNDSIAALRESLARREESQKGQWHEIDRLRERVDSLPAEQARIMAEHVASCPLQEITEVGIKLPPRDHLLTPRDGVRRPSMHPSANVRLNRKVAIGIGAGIVLAITGLGIWIGVALSTGSADQATGAVRGVVEKVITTHEAQADAQ